MDTRFKSNTSFYGTNCTGQHTAKPWCEIITSGIHQVYIYIIGSPLAKKGEWLGHPGKKVSCITLTQLVYQTGQVGQPIYGLNPIMVDPQQLTSTKFGSIHWVESRLPPLVSALCILFSGLIFFFQKKRTNIIGVQVSFKTFELYMN